ncbi:MAG: 2-amino-4-hydroxy-6-hydroxymethyldihydropteridine diphosphokinase [Flavobacteriaceae bacterium]|nr:2-amino-4-hydroxy-6-hydroxymethyldihydropteridine diphosphokinase [Flavobacteriaceae bacterium]
MNTATLLLGSNLKNRKKNIETALAFINQEVGVVKKKSEFLETEPVGYESEHLYINAGAVVETNLSPIQLLKQVKSIEKKMGREHDSSISGHLEDRIIDIDIIYYEKIRYKSKKLILPHLAHTTERAFSKEILRHLVE